RRGGERGNLVFAGTSVVGGTGKAVVCATGMETEFGRIAAMTQGVREELSPLQREIRHVTKIVSAVAVTAGLVFFSLATLLIGMELSLGFIFAMGMIVAFVPEGLLPTVTLSLAMGVQRMARRQALVKQLSSVETLGRTSIICTDKTGTLTRNEMTVLAIWSGGQHYQVFGTGYAPQGKIHGADGLPVNGGDLKPLLLVAALCNNARLLPPSAGQPGWRVLGDPTEGALLVAAAKGGLDPAAEAAKAPRLQEIPFEAVRRRMCTVHRCGSVRRSFMKGATHEVLAHCRALLRGGQEEELTDTWREAILQAMEGYARQGLRVLAFAWGMLPEGTAANWVERVENDLVFLGLMAMEDPPRPEVAEAVDRCHRAGIRLIMISGDYGLTAEAVARQIGLVRVPGAPTYTGADLHAMDESALREVLGSGEVILARVAPEHKMRIVVALQRLGHVVAMTGDGVNDAPALKQADIGVAMGRGGTEVAREAADMILLDDNFASIVAAVEEGRGVYENIRKFTSYIFTSNTPEAVPFILYAFSGGSIPLALNIMHILAIDLGTDLVPALALGREPPEPGIMERPPHRLKAHLIDWPLLARAYLWLGPAQALAAMSAFYFQFWSHGYWGQWTGLPSSGPLYASATAMALAAVVVTQIGNLFAHRSESVPLRRQSWTSNPLIWGGIAVEVSLVAAIIYLPPLQKLFGTAPFPLSNWLFLLVWLPALPLMDEARKALRDIRRQKRAPAADR
ncbi:MAG: cation-transporting P-type ATPase, partial [Desulfuromonadales bacterium]|nr:cation-transporting P-type ATPase [Desulfuromonadales bacterium]